MPKDRYFQWIAVFEWFWRHKRSPEALYDMLNETWQQDRQATRGDELAAYAAAYRERGKFDVERDPAFQKWWRELNSNPPEPPKE